MTTDPLTSLLPELITTDPLLRDHIRARFTELIDVAFDELLDMMETGDRASRAMLAKQLLPVIIKVQRDTEDLDTEDLELMRDETRGMIAELGRLLPGADEAVEELGLTVVPDIPDAS